MRGTSYTGTFLNKLKKREILVLLIILAIGLFLRTWRLESTPEFCFDEGWHCDIALHMHKGEIAVSYGRQSSPFFDNPSLFMFFLSVTFLLFGFGILQARILGVLFSMLVIMAIYFFTKEVYSDRAGMIAALLISLDYFMVFFGRKALLDSPVVFFMTLALFLLIKGYKEDSNKKLALSGLNMGLAVITKHPAILVFLILPLFLFLIEKNFHWIKTKRFWMIIVIALIPIFAYIIIGMIVSTPDIFIESSLTHLRRPPEGLPPIEFWQWLFLWDKWLFISLIGMIYSLIKREKSDIIPVLWALTTIALFSAIQVRHNNYTIEIIPPLAILAARFLADLTLSEIPGEMSLYKIYAAIMKEKKFYTPFVIALIILFSVYELNKNIRILQRNEITPQLVAEYLNANTEKTDIILVNAAIGVLSKRIFVDFHFYEGIYWIREMEITIIVIDEHWRDAWGVPEELKQFLDTQCEYEITIKTAEIWRV